MDTALKLLYMGGSKTPLVVSRDWLPWVSWLAARLDCCTVWCCLLIASKRRETNKANGCHLHASSCMTRVCGYNRRCKETCLARHPLPSGDWLLPGCLADSRRHSGGCMHDRAFLVRTILPLALLLAT